MRRPSDGSWCFRFWVRRYLSGDPRGWPARHRDPAGPGTLPAVSVGAMLPTPRYHCFVALLLALVMAPGLIGPAVRATVPSTAEAAEHSMRQFLAQGDLLRPYRAMRRLEARNGDSVGWLHATTEFAPTTGLRYTITAEGGSGRIRDRVLRAVLDGEREVIAKGGMARSTLAPCNYEFQANGVDANGLAKVLLSPRRKEPVLLAGTMFLRPTDGELVRVEGRLAKSPSFWVKNVDIVRTYERINGVVVPVALDTTAQVRMFGQATLRMTYAYSEIDGRPVGGS
jgi:hypothetical protein